MSEIFCGRMVLNWNNQYYLKLDHEIMFFKSFHWLSLHGIWAITSWSTKMLNLRVIFWGVFNFILFQLSLFGGVLDKTITSLTYVGYEVVIANSVLRASLAIYHLVSNARSWNNCLRTVPTFLSAHTFCASPKPWFSSTRALGLTLTQSTTLSRTRQNESKIFLLWPNQV